jgi:hypothetical protein
MTLMHSGQPAASAQVQASHNGVVVASGATSSQGTLTLTVPWTDLLFTATHFGLQCNFAILPANNTDISVTETIPCS